MPELELVLTVFAVPIIAADLTATALRERSVRGSRGRYLWASIARVTDLLTGVVMLAVVWHSLATGNVVVAIAAGVIIVVAIVAQARRRDEDDDYWTGLGRRVRDRARAGRDAPAVDPA